ncbi:hypothetical protein [Nonomuraea gerenzanensis]|uniref:DNA primase/helicase, phage-associated n=1 Tax=Nonomuraea gerenzanensis TaxID=93944 RepID=A0A1M4EMR7_9ACTN|nr:hypothetical protein [Nonomuraea gerenzanensis]UBU11620.1 hypothetical protein LCN96_46160 [Nonomuraea gerenzanensis]SBP00114.1 hypothetical protein BN4615_P9630 [Nonomuraea gerenzanensis]
MTITAEDITRSAFAEGGEAIPADLRHRIDITHEDEAVNAIVKAINTNVIPDVYVRSGEVCEVCEIDDGEGPRLVIRPVDADRLRLLLAEHTYCYRSKTIKTEAGSKTIETSGLPAVSTGRAVLSRTSWPGLNLLAGVIGMPIIRPDGTVLATPGYDSATRLYYQPALAVGPIPDQPTLAEVSEARMFVFDYVLTDFCWDSDASKANYFAALMTPILRRFIGGLPPFILISAATRGSGKSLLTEIMKAAYGIHMTPWVRREEEFKKKITSLFQDTSEPVIVFDNVEPFDTISHGSLSMLLTSTKWSERILGASNMFTALNDRLWAATGNNLSVGGDVASRSVLTRLDPRMERPEERSGFAIDDLWSWLGEEANRADLLRSLLILARAWIADGAEKDTTRRMRNFTSWAQAMGGLIAYHGLPDFLANLDELTTGSDDEETSTAAFILKWFSKYGTAPQRATALVDSARVDNFGGTLVDPWDGTFPSTYKDGKNIPFTAKGLGKFLAARRDRIFAGHVLRADLDKKSKVWSYRVLPHDEEADQ